MKLGDRLAMPAELDREVSHRLGEGFMSRLGISVLALLGLVACSGGTFEGQLVDALDNDAPLAGQTLIARATGKARLTCQLLTGVTDDQGYFKISGLCLNDTAYRLTDARDSLFFAEVDEIPKGGAGSLVVIRAWHAPTGAGVYLLSGGELNPIPTHSDLREEEIYRSTEKVLYPKSVPDLIPTVAVGDHLVITGKDNMQKMSLHPLIRSEGRRFGTNDQWVEMAPWWYVGTHFTSDTEFERVDVDIARDHIVEMEKGDHAARFVKGDALPAGLYVLTREGGRRATVIQFGQPEAPAKVAKDEE
jgi:hypothetical protein